MNPRDCKHIRFGVHECAAGVNYAAHTGQTAPGSIEVRLPCRYRQFGTGTERFQAAIIPCALRQEPSAEELAASMAESKREWRNIEKVLEAVSTWRVKPKPPHDRKAVIDCPCCGKHSLHMVQLASNGHTRGRCDTDGCVRWME